jgi:uncharacterized protein (TIGR02646 family)
MRRIIKGLEPIALRKWKVDNQNVPENLTYGALHGNETRAIRRQMLLEQGYLCAYTMQRIQTVEDCHIEHLVPQTQDHDRDLDYDNMLACFPGTKPPPEWNPKFPYGAQQKGGTRINDTNFVSPLSVDVENRFQYTLDGSVQATATDAAALSSIEILRLDHSILCELRKAAIEERVLDASLSAEEAIELASTISSPDSSGMLPEFCLAIAQVSDWYAKALGA